MKERGPKPYHTVALLSISDDVTLKLANYIFFMGFSYMSKTTMPIAFLLFLQVSLRPSVAWNTQDRRKQLIYVSILPINILF